MLAKPALLPLLLGILSKRTVPHRELMLKFAPQQTGKRLHQRKLLNDYKVDTSLI